MCWNRPLFRPDRFTFEQRQPHDRAGEFGDGIRPFRFRYETVDHIALWPGCPAHGTVVQAATDGQIDRRDENVDRRFFLDDRFCFFDDLLRAGNLHGDKAGKTGGHQSNGKNKDTRFVSCSILEGIRFFFPRMARDWYNYG